MQVDLTADHFALFGLDRGFALDRGRLTRRYRELQQVLHPDRFGAAPESERRWSVQAASRVNDAYTTLRDPLRRAVYLLSLAGVSVDEESDTRMDPDFLMEQMELREALEAAGSAVAGEAAGSAEGAVTSSAGSAVDAAEGAAAGAADPHAALDAVRARLRALERAQAEGFEAAMSSGDTAAARTAVRQWQFVDKLGREVGEIEARLDG